MLHGSLIRLPDGLDVTSLNGLVWARRQNDTNLRSILQFEGVPFPVAGRTAHQATVIHEHIVQQPVMTENGGRFTITYADAVVPSWANCFIMPGIAIVSKLSHRPFVVDIVNHGANPRLVIPAKEIAINTARMSADHRDQWIRAFHDRAGRIDKGTVYGDGVEQDPVFGQELEHSNCGSLGWITDAFGDPVKVRISPKGSITVFADMPTDVFLRFILNEILPYATHF